MSAKPTTKAAAKKAAKKKPRRAWFPGKMGRSEIQPLVLAAREAYDYQEALGNIDAGQSFDDWRRAQVLAKVGRSGLSECVHDDYQPLMGHFQVLAGRDGDALESFLSTGPATKAEGDDHEERRRLAHVIMETLAAHIWLAEVGAQELAEKTENTIVYQGLRRRREAIRGHKDGAIREGYLVWLVRQKTRRPDLTLGKDLKAGLADRCTVPQLVQIRDTLVNRIAVREGREDKGRNKKQKSKEETARRSPHELAPRFDLPDDLDPF
jgi:hypothetical protein